MQLLCSREHEGIASYMDLIQTHGLTASAIQSMLDYELVSYRPSKGTGTSMRDAKGPPPYIIVPGRAQLIAMRELLGRSEGMNRKSPRCWCLSTPNPT